MKRSYVGGAAEDNSCDLIEKQRKISSLLYSNLCSNANTKDSSPLNENCDSSTALPVHNDILKERNNDVEASSDLLPSLNDSILNNVSTDLADENAYLRKQVAELKESNSKLTDDLEFLEKRHGDVLKIKGSFNEEEMKQISIAYTEKRQYYHRALNAEKKIEKLKGTLERSQQMVQKKDQQRLEIQLQHNNTQNQFTAERNAKEKAFEENEKLQAEVKKLQSNIANKNDLILRLNGGQQQPCPSAPSVDTVTIAELQQIISTKENTIMALQKTLQESYEVQENLKDEKREAVSEKENFKKRNEELREAAKLSKEKITKLEEQLEDAHENLGKIQTEIEQNAYEVSFDNDTLSAKVDELRETIKAKNQQIADLNVGQVLLQEQKNAEIEKPKAEIKELKGKLAYSEKERIDMLAEYNNMKAQRDDAMKEINDLKLENEFAQRTTNDLNTVKSELIAEKEILKKDLDISRQYEQQRAIELSDEVWQHQQTVQKYETLIQKATEFVKKAYFLKNKETKKAVEFEAKFLECQTQLTKALEDRQQIDGQMKNIKEKLGDEIVAKEIAVKKNGEFEGQLSQMKADVEKQRSEWQKKIDEMGSQIETERKDASVKYEKLETENIALTKSNEKLQADLATSEKQWPEKAAEFQEFVQKFLK